MSQDEQQQNNEQDVEQTQSREHSNDMTESTKPTEEETEKKGLFAKKKCKNCDKKETEAKEYQEGWQRAQADYRNLQKEVEKMRSEWVRMSELQILEEFIPVYDNFKKAFGYDADSADGDADNADVMALKKSFQNWRKGIEYIMQQFGNILKAHDVEEIKTVGEQFNPELHEALSEEEVEGKESGTIIREIDAGYMMKGKVIKVAKVVVVS